MIRTRLGSPRHFLDCDWHANVYTLWCTYVSRLWAISADIALDACSLPGDFHEDPFDRMIVATARHHNCALVSADKKILAYPSVKSAW